MTGVQTCALPILDQGECLSAQWQALIEFAAKYYHHPLGMIALEALPKALRVLNARGEEPVMVAKSREHAMKLLAERTDPDTSVKANKTKIDKLEKPELNAEQLDAVAQLANAKGFNPFLLYGVTGSGKTEVYLHTVEERLKQGEQVLVLLPETWAALRAAVRNRMQTSLNLALGSVLATIGLTIPVVAAVSMAIGMPLELGLPAKEIVLLALTLLVSAITLASGRATVMQGAVHLVIFAAFLFLAVVP